MFVKKYMTPNPLTVRQEEDVKEVFQLLVERGIRQAPVLEDGKLVGIITDRDLRMAVVQSSKESNLVVGDIMTPNPITVTEYTKVEEAARLICRNKFNALPVVSDKGEIVGIITTTDILEGMLEVLASAG
ncbi:MAG TPA: CBS domain-containing protein [Thermodesulfobacteriota bacterium]|nr:CBS domain-containing protein [Thermodesulfobacteriota bacterium]